MVLYDGLDMAVSLHTTLPVMVYLTGLLVWQVHKWFTKWLHDFNSFHFLQCFYILTNLSQSPYLMNFYFHCVFFFLSYFMHVLFSLGVFSTNHLAWQVCRLVVHECRAVSPKISFLFHSLSATAVPSSACLPLSLSLPHSAWQVQWNSPAETEELTVAILHTFCTFLEFVLTLYIFGIFFLTKCSWFSVSTLLYYIQISPLWNE